MKFRALLLALALVFGTAGISSAAVTDHRETAVNLSVAYPVLSLDDTAAADRINADIRAFAESYRAQFESGAFYRGELGYRVHLDDDNFLSVTFSDLRYALRENTPVRRDYGFVCPIFQAGELTASTGPTYILLDASIVDYFNRKNK